MLGVSHFKTRPGRHYLLIFVLAIMRCEVIHSQNDADFRPQGITAETIVRKLAERDQQRADQLVQLTSERHYHLRSRYLGGISEDADLEAEVRYETPERMTFRELSEDGSNFLVKRVLRQLLEEEQQAVSDPSRIALSAENYNFVLIGQTMERGRVAFVLSATPRHPQKFLLRGKVWIDIKDFAVSKIEAEPSKSPSFWVGSTKFIRVYSKVGALWLPELDIAESRTRLGGVADLTINYDRYDFPPNQHQSQNLPPSIGTPEDGRK